MSWETINESKSVCGCGKGYIQYETRTDDWNRYEEYANLYCNNCEVIYMEYSYDVHNSGLIESRVCWVKKEDFKIYAEFKKVYENAVSENNNRITEYMLSNYYDQWMTLFEGIPRNKKAIWGKLKELRLTHHSYSSFCKNTSDIEAKIVSYLTFNRLTTIQQILRINDDTFNLPKKTTKEHLSKYNEARSLMMKNSFR